MVMRPGSPGFLLCALAGLWLAACISPNTTGLVHDAAGADGADSSGPRPDAAPDGAVDMPSPADTSDRPGDMAGDSTVPPPDVTPTECTPRALGCSDDNKSVRTCSEQGRWVPGPSCAAQTACSAGVCVCTESCSEDLMIQAQTPGFVEDLTGGGRYLYLAVNGPLASIRRFDLTTKLETVVKSSAPDVGLFALDSDAMGNLLWCSEISTGTTTRTGQLVYGTQQIDTGPCTRVRRRNNFAYFKSDVLYRRTLDPSAARETVTREAMDSFEIAGEHLYFVGELNNEAFLKRFALADPMKVETITRRMNAGFFRLMPDPSHVYLISDGQILRVAQTANAQAETFWQEAGPEAWAMAQTDTHVYWSTMTAAGAMDCTEAQVLRQAKAGGPVATLARTPGYCAGQLVRIDNQIYTAVWKTPPSTAPTRILRIRL